MLYFATTIGMGTVIFCAWPDTRVIRVTVASLWPGYAVERRLTTRTSLQHTYAIAPDRSQTYTCIVYISSSMLGLLSSACFKDTMLLGTPVCSVPVALIFQQPIALWISWDLNGSFQYTSYPWDQNGSMRSTTTLKVRPWSVLFECASPKGYTRFLLPYAATLTSTCIFL